MYLQRQAVLPWPLLLVLLGFRTTLVTADVNITLEDTASQIIYSPSACGLTLTPAGTVTQSQICDSAWRIIASADASGGTLTTTSGPTNSSGGLIPQLFLSVRARALYVKTPSSNAIVNVSVSTINPIVTVRSELNSSLEFISIIGLPEETVTTLSLTFVEFDFTTFLEIDSIIVSISDNKYHNAICFTFLTTIDNTPYRHPIHCYTQSKPAFRTIRTNQRRHRSGGPRSVPRRNSPRRRRISCPLS
ncbi:hypothetical protein BV20DRAFT_956016 [Pilatotrama ljubarskyi]|nr:hypothetical protein BV20DRAFT_956016 [Pilatotrama ljubarskyi]